MILLFLGSWRSTLIIAVSIPLSILTSIIVPQRAGRDHQHHDARRPRARRRHSGRRRHRDIENINRNLEQGKDIAHAILDGAAQIAIPALVSTLCICIVFMPMFFLSGVARYLFVPLAEAVVFAMLASYLLSRTLVPTLAKYLLASQTDEARGATKKSRIRSCASSAASSAASSTCATGYHGLLDRCVRHARALRRLLPRLLPARRSRSIPFLGQDFFPGRR